MAKMEALEKKKLRSTRVARAKARPVKHQLQVGTYLIVSPFLTRRAPATVVVGELVLNYYSKARREACGKLQTFLRLSMGLSYVLLFLLSYLFVGPKPFRSFKQLKVAPALKLCLGLHGIGTLWLLAALGNEDGPCNDYSAGRAPGLVHVYGLHRVLLAGGAHVGRLLARGCRRAMKQQQEEERQREQERLAEKMLKEEMRRKKKAEKKAKAEAERVKQQQDAAAQDDPGAALRRRRRR